ncbi:MAG: hypothetical protein KAI17_00900 [Thiotrichaceae bacterium]|nr:hypothetical protein [Thiotrichaceae bacterium]
MNILKKTKLAMAVTAFVGIASVSNVNAIQVNTDGSGRVLLAPVMFAMDGASTKITVTNTNVYEAVKAHLAIRTEKESQEVFDFILYLSPGDSFRGEFYAGSDNQVLFRTSDDSIKVLNFIGATEEPPFVGDINPETGEPYTIEGYVVPTNKIPEGDSINIGHMEVIGVYSVNGVVKAAKIQPGDAEEITIVRGMDKRSLRRIFDMTTPALLAMNGCSDTGADGVSCTNIDAVGSKSAVLRGDINIANINYAMTGLVDSDENSNGTIDCAVEYCEKVVANPFFNQNSGEEIQMGFQMGIATSTTSAAHNLYNIDRALSRPVYNGTYEEGTTILTSLPTKYMHRGRDYCTNPGMPPVPLNSNLDFSAPFNDEGNAFYNLAVFNNSEERCDIIAPPIDIDSVTLAESGKSCADIDDGREWFASLNPDGTLLCTTAERIVPQTFHWIGYEVQGVPLHCGNEQETAEWFSVHTNGWYKMKFEEMAPQGISCGYEGVPVTVHSIKAEGDLITTSN